MQYLKECGNFKLKAAGVEMRGAIENQAGGRIVFPDDSCIPCRTLSKSWGIQGASFRRKGQYDPGWVSGHSAKGFGIRAIALASPGIQASWAVHYGGHMQLLKLNKGKNSIPKSCQPHFKCTVVTCVLLYWTMQIQNISISAEFLLDIT